MHQPTGPSEPADRGLAGYRELQAWLSQEISPAEAERARRLAREAILALLIGAACVVAMAFAVVPIRGHTEVAGNLMLGAAPLAIAMALVTHWRVPFAGRTLLPLAALLAPTSHDWLYSWFTAATLLSGPQLYVDTLALGLRLGAALLIGWLVDAAVHSGRSRRRRWSWRFGVLLMCVAMYGLAPDLQRIGSTNANWSGAENLARIALLAVWAGFVHPRFANRERNGALDAALLFRIALSRWRRLCVGRLLAVASLLVILIAVINGFALPDALAPDTPDRPLAAQAAFQANDRPSRTMFVWPRGARLLRESDLQDPDRDLYIVDPAAEIVDRLQRYVLANTRTALLAPGYDSLKQALAPWRISTPEGFAAALARQADAPMSARQIWLLQRHPGHDPQGTTYELEALHRVLIPVDEAGLTRFGNRYALVMFGAGAFACLAFVVLWRRGGDIAAARWVGLWLAGIAMSFSLPIVDLIVASTLVDAAQSTSEPSVRATVSGASGLLFLFSLIAGVLATFCVTPWMIYRSLRPSLAKRVPGESPALVGMGYRLLDGQIPILAGIGAVIALILWLDHEKGMPMSRIVPIAGGASLLGMWALERLRRPRIALLQPSGGDRRLRITGPSVMFFVAAQALLSLSFSLRSDETASLTPAGAWVAMTMVAIFTIAATVFLLRSEWLRVSAGHDLSWLMTAFLMPLLFEIVNGTLPAWLDSLDIFLPGASGIASFLLVVVLMQPMQRGLEAAFRQIASRTLNQVQRRVDALLEDALATSGQQALPAQVERLFEELGIRGYALYTRTGPCSFDIELDRLAGKPSFSLSQGLCRRLARSETVIDLDMVHAEWRYFFDQFELHRLAQCTRGRYLYRVRIGGALNGILVLGNSAAAQGIARDGFAETASALGIVLSKWRR